MARAKKKVTCQDCDMTFGRKGDLQQHRREEHSRRNMCLICKRAFESEKRLKMHLQFHNAGGKYKCFYCSKEFNKAWKMKIHLVNHSGRSSYVCEFCGDDFLYPGKIVAHLKLMHDVFYACKDCGYAIPIEDSQESHKCRIYGCKDCPMSFVTKGELADHVSSQHGGQGIGPQCEGLPEGQRSRGSPQDVSPGSTGVGDDDDCDLEPVLVVAEDISDSRDDDQGITRLETAAARTDRMPRQAPRHAQGNNSSRGDNPSPVSLEESRDPDPQRMEVEDRLSQDTVVSPSLPGTPSCPSSHPAANHSAAGRYDTGDSMLSRKGRKVKRKLSVIGSTREGVVYGDIPPSHVDATTWEDDREQENRGGTVNRIVDEKTEPPPSYISSILRSPGFTLSRGFKVPGASPGLWKRQETHASKSLASLRRKQDELNQRKLLNTLHLHVDTDARLTQCSKTSLKSWLTGDSFPFPEHDYVFGFEASVSVGGGRDEAHYHYHYFNKKLPKKKKVDMTFEDLCLF